MSRIFITLLIFQFAFSCNSNSQNQSAKDSHQITSFKIDSISDYTGNDEKTPLFIKNRLEKLIGKSLKEKCISVGVKYPPQFVEYRFFKLEREFEIWIADKRSDTLKILAVLPVCAADFQPGTKIKEGDGKTPEGFYKCSLLYGSSYGFMWMKLNNSELNDFGSPGYGSSFKLCIDYPKVNDITRTKKVTGTSKTGGQICIHGNCVSAGCISFKNKDFLPVFLTSAQHNKSAYGNTQIQIYPFRFSQEKKNKYSQSVNSEMNPEELLNFWNELEKGYLLFEKNHKALKVTYSGEKYIFSQY